MSAGELATIADALEGAGIPRDAIFNSGNALIMTLAGAREITVRDEGGELQLTFVLNSVVRRLRFTKEHARLVGAFLLSWGYK